MYFWYNMGWRAISIRWIQHSACFAFHFAEKVYFTWNFTLKCHKAITSFVLVLLSPNHWYGLSGSAGLSARTATLNKGGYARAFQKQGYRGVNSWSARVFGIEKKGTFSLWNSSKINLIKGGIFYVQKYSSSSNVQVWYIRSVWQAVTHPRFNKSHHCLTCQKSRSPTNCSTEESVYITH